MNTTHIAKLKSQKLKLTPKRKAILDCFVAQGKHLTPDDVWKVLKRKFKSLGLPSIYRNLESFTECGLLAKIHREDRRLYYALCQSHANSHHHHHHHHIVCIKCGKVDDVDGCMFEKMDKVSGYKVIKHTVQLEGLCPKCI